jgi:hypothetical protein
MSNAPIVLFAYNRLDSLKLTLEALKKNYLASDSDLFIYSDGWKNEKDRIQIDTIREFLRTVSGFKQITIIEQNKNLGLAQSIITGISEVLAKFESVIVLEDDLITSVNFLVFMNQALQHYRETSNVFSISGFTPPIQAEDYEGVYFTKRASSWGWGTWNDRWFKVDWSVQDYLNFKVNRKQRNSFNKMGSDMCKMLDAQMNGKINSWAIRWTYWQFKNDLFTVFPVISKVENIGTSEFATNTKDSFGRFKTVMDETGRDDFVFDEIPHLESQFLKPFLKQFSVATRIKFKLLNFLFSK